MTVLKKTGLPVGDMSKLQEKINAQTAIEQAVRGEDSSVAAAKKAYMDKINQIAQADQKLSQAYTDPNSKLFIENPVQRQQLLTGAQDVGYNQASDLYKGYTTAKKDVEDKISGLVSMYNQVKPGAGSELQGLIDGLSDEDKTNLFGDVNLNTLNIESLYRELSGETPSRPEISSFNKPDRPDISTFNK
jgi:hypothetical protein